jgi:hypothetical protein
MPLKVQVFKPDCSSKFRREIESLFDSLFVVSDAKYSSREPFLSSTYAVP